MKRSSGMPSEILKGSRARTRRRTLVKLFVGWGIVFILLGGAWYGLSATDALVVQNVTVTGARLVDADAVMSALTASLKESAFRNWVGERSMFFWLFAKPPVSFLDKYPVFRDVAVVPSIFSRTVTISVTERALYGVWCLAGGAPCYAFDGEGYVFAAAPSVRGSLIVRIDDARKTSFAAGDRVLQDAAWQTRLFDVLGALDRVGLVARHIQVKDPSVREWEVALANGPLLKFSFSFFPSQLENALGTLSRRGDFPSLAYLDFRVPDRLYYK